ncbi:hypothetical protein JCM19046_2326 [Bacillus sp. JCM 19046]|uniref:Uncharacterized protein n=1 Tax=Shouchella xiaoxiensis TaxID=766895 RepID=A0ABS2SWY1_9BACI|nr:hypothetical protein [Shouchella xiaoxiensis]MBM7839999.1 hypothetical protein [Shouchella xiaoxiensis]GAF12640.1 hypothetical protein JCM19045_1848 [Bacillus sp. JCM 19045]GAF17798.1 hypothetical protein JCM19046_2326 [Bacillus sp. JCM 19046]
MNSLILYLLAGVLIGFVTAGQLGVMLGLIAGILMQITMQLDQLLKKNKINKKP